MLLRDFIRDAISSLENLYPQAEARSIVLMLCEELLGVKSYTHVVEPGYEIDVADMPRLSEALRRLCASEPVQYVLGHADFYGHRFHVTRDVLIPRPETEILVQEAVALAGDGNMRILDLCTGSGCIAWSLALALPGAEVTGVDISEAALGVARGQGLATPGMNAPGFVLADILKDPVGFGEEASFDIIVSNPPYVMESQRAQMRSNVLDYEPELALFVSDEDPLVFYRAVAAWAKRLLLPGGRGIVEINDLLADSLTRLFSACGFSDITPIYDLSGAVRHISFLKRL